MDLSIVIVNYNVKYYLEQCLYSVRMAVKEIKTQVIVVDNASVDDSLSYLENKFPEVSFIRNTQNEGFAKANNRVLKDITGTYLLYLNPDTIVTTASILESVAFLKKQSDAGAVGVKMLDGQACFLPESKRGKMSLWNSFTKFSGLSRSFSKSAWLTGYHLGHLNKNLRHPVKVLSGAFLMIRTALAQAIGGFDERFFMYGEDIEMSYAIQDKGYRNYYLGDLAILHFKGESTVYDATYFSRFFAAMEKFLEKRGSRIEKFISKPLIEMLRISKTQIHKINSNSKERNKLIRTSFSNPIKKEKGSIKMLGVEENVWIHQADDQNTYDKIITSIESQAGSQHYVYWVDSAKAVSTHHVISVE